MLHSREGRRGPAPSRQSSESAPDPETLFELLRSHKVRVSSRRAEIIRTLVRRSERHPTAEEVYQEVRQSGGRIGIATVYNTLELLRRVGAVSELGFSSGPARFDLNLTPHANLVCTECGKISDLPVGQLERMAKELGIRSHFEVHRQRLDLYGLCSECQKPG